MKTRIEDMKENFCSATLDQAGQIIKRGGLVAFPTETVYGLGADALNEKACAKIYEAKGRPSDNPLIIHIARIEDLSYIVKEVPQTAQKLAAAFWPGPLTMILKKSDRVPYGTTGGLETVAVRMPDHQLAQALIKASGGFLAAPSANTSGRPSPTSASHVARDLAGKIEMILDGGEVCIGLESTIVDLSGEVPAILRPGYITRKMLEQVLGPVMQEAAIMDEHSAVRPKAPGMKYRHYSPRADLVIVTGEQQKVIQRINQLIEKGEAAGRGIGVIGTDETAGEYHGGIIKSIGSRTDEISIAKHLYGILREFDELDVSQIYSEAFDTPKIGQAIMNRLIKASGHQIMEV